MQIEPTAHDGKPVDKEVLRLLITQLTNEQFAAAWKAANQEEKGIVWWKVGEGKTRIALTWMFFMAREPKPLVVCSPGAFRQWQDEIITLRINHRIEPKFLSCGMLSQKNDPTVNFEEINCIVIDELWMYKNIGTNRSKRVRQLTSRKPSIGLSGSMITAGNIEDLYGQAKAMNLDQKVASGLTNFREQYCISTTNYAGFIERFPRKGAVEVIQKKLIANIDVYFPKETKTIRDIKVNVEPTPEQDKLRKELTRTYYHESADFRLEIKNAATLLVKLQQISDGFLKDTEGNYLHVRSAKADRLTELCNELLAAGERILVWVAFKETAKLLSEVLRDKTTILSSDGQFDVRGWTTGKIPICIATIGSGASLNDFANVRYSILYSTGFSALNVQQAKGRTNRKSSLHNCCYYYYLQTMKFPDADIFQAIEDNVGREEAVIRITNRILTEWKNDN